MEWNLTSALAIWGSSLATLTFIWNVSKCLRERPRLAVRVELHENPFGAGISFEIRNRGEKPTTVEEIKLVKYSNDIWGMLGFADHITDMCAMRRDEVKLPVSLNYGEVWKGYASFGDQKGRGPTLNRSNNMELIANGKLLYKVRCAHTDRLLSGKVVLEPDSMRI